MPARLCFLFNITKMNWVCQSHFKAFKVTRLISKAKNYQSSCYSDANAQSFFQLLHWAFSSNLQLNMKQYHHDEKRVSAFVCSKVDKRQLFGQEWPPTLVGKIHSCVYSWIKKTRHHEPTITYFCCLVTLRFNPWHEGKSPKVPVNGRDISNLCSS